MGVKGMWKDPRTSPVDILVRRQEQRLLWLLVAVVMGALIILAYSLFQIYLYMIPHKQCVYIRYAMLVMVIGGLVVATNLENTILKLIGCVMALYDSILGLKLSLKLNDIHRAVHNPDPDSLFDVQGCSTDPIFPSNPPLTQWASNWFKSTGDCGYDALIVPDGVTLSNTQQWFVEMYQQSEGWHLLPPWHFMNMIQVCMLALGMCLVLLVTMSDAWVLKIIRG